MECFDNLGVIKNELSFDPVMIAMFEDTITKLKQNKAWTKEEIVELFNKVLQDFGHKDTGKYLDGKM